MKVEVKENKSKKKDEFPKLMINSVGLIVLALDNDSCVILEIGSSGWCGISHEKNMIASMAEMKPFNGTITLSND